MQKLSEADIVKCLEAGETFECQAEDGSFILKVEAYAPVVCAAVHAGHNFRASLEKYCALSERERLYEEDPFTDQLIQSMPITLVAKDSRYEYDLNRPLARCIYQRAWGKTVWHKALPDKERRLSTAKHRGFYRVLDALVGVLENRFGACLIFDVHAYNHLRHPLETPTFNLGLEQVDEERWSPVYKRLLKQLGKIRLDNLRVWAAANEVFFGRGYLIAHINSRFEHSLVLPMEVKKVFMDESSGEAFPLVIQQLSEALKQSFSECAAFFARRHTRKSRVKRVDMLSSEIDPAITRVDAALFRLAKNLETLHYINPINVVQEQKRFFSKNGNYQPQFRYRPLVIDPYAFREQLYRLPVESIRDMGIQQLYRSVIDALSSKIDLLVNAGKAEFVYNSLKYYGEPSLDDERNAHFLLHAVAFEAEEPADITATLLKQRFAHQARAWGMDCKVEISSRLVAAAMVSNSKRTLYIAKNICLNETDARALLHHELGVHMATTLNAAIQPLKVFALGLPGNTMTQEGLAILNEYHTGNLPLLRLQKLALRVLAVKEMLNYGDFRHTYSFLREEYQVGEQEAFNITTRVHRGGGFTKDYLYLRGVSEALRLHSEGDISNLYIGKTGFAALNLLNEMAERGLLNPPRYVPPALTEPAPACEILNYLMSSIHPVRDHRITGGSEQRPAVPVANQEPALAS